MLLLSVNVSVLAQHYFDMNREKEKNYERIIYYGESQLKTEKTNAIYKMLLEVCYNNKSIFSYY